MAAFEYIALDGRGKERKGVLEGDTPRSVRQALREQSLTPMSVAQVESGKSVRQSLELLCLIDPCRVDAFDHTLIAADGDPIDRGVCEGAVRMSVKAT